MTWFHWLLVALFALEAVAVVGTIGDSRKPRTRSDAVVQVILNALLIWGVVAYR